MTTCYHSEQRYKDNMAKRIEVDGKFYRMRRGVLVEIPCEWAGKIPTKQTRKRRQRDARGRDFEMRRTPLDARGEDAKRRPTHAPYGFGRRYKMKVYERYGRANSEREVVKQQEVDMTCG